MIWEDPQYLWLLLLIPLFVLLLWWKNRDLLKKREQYFSSDLFNKLRIGYWSTGSKLKTVLLLSGLSFVILGLAGPKIGTEVREIKRRGIDLLIALDLSASMNAEDVRPSRLDKAKFEVNRLIERLKGDRVGLVVFTGDAFLQSPMTLDYSALRLFLEIADTDQMPGSATDFNAAMQTALEAFNALEDDKENNINNANAAKVLLIISDGEDHGQSYEESLEALIDSNISIYTVGVGTREGTTIPLYEEGTNELIGYKRDNDGQIVTTKLQSSILQEIANQGNGAYYAIQRGNQGIDAFLGRVDELEKGEFSSQEYADFKNQYQWMAALGLMCLLLSLVIPDYRRSKD